MKRRLQPYNRQVMVRVVSICWSLAFLLLSSLAQEEEGELITGKQFPDGFGVVKSSLSPDGRYGVLAPDWDHYEDGQPQNKLVEVKTGRVLAVIKAETGLVRMNHGGILPSRWSSDGLFLLWHVDGKWSPRALVLLKVDKGEVKWQRDLLKLAQQEILARTRKAVLRKYPAARKRNAGLSDEAYPGGMTIINVVTEGEEDAPLVLPVTINAELESNPKAIEDSPKSTEVNSEMHAKIDAEGKFSVKDFHLE
jgi:hypothetical protein